LGTIILLPNAFLLPVVLPVCNQGKRTTCVAFSGVSIVEYHSGGHYYLSPKLIGLDIYEKASHHKIKHYMRLYIIIEGIKH